jgi:pimeloyl-ACP methyl ester carboxylesterase
MLRHLSFENMVLDMEALRAHLKIERWSIFGGSWGTAFGFGSMRKSFLIV